MLRNDYFITTRQDRDGQLGKFSLASSVAVYRKPPIRLHLTVSLIPRGGTLVNRLKTLELLTLDIQSMNLSAGLILMCLFVSGETGKYNPVLDIGDDAPKWQNLPGTDDNKHSFDDLSDYEAVVVVFTCNSCPYAVDYEDRLNKLHESFEARKVALIAINVNRIPADSMDAMKVRAEEKGFKFAYLYDESQQIAKDYGATYTPEFFVLDKERKIAYMGAFDDDTDADNVEQEYLANALEAVLSGRKPEVTETPAVGCRIRIQRSRRRD